MNKLEQSQLLEAFEYRDGNLFWKVSRGRAKAGDKAGCKNWNGYAFVGFNGKQHMAHRVIFLIHRGFMPEYVDHINRNPSDNRIENLRACTNSENLCNAKLPKHNTSGVKGITWLKREGKWQARIWVNGKAKSIGRFASLDDAKQSVMKAREFYHEEFANHG